MASFTINNAANTPANPAGEIEQLHVRVTERRKYHRSTTYLKNDAALI
jgi:hypothetical protein